MCRGTCNCICCVCNVCMYYSSMTCVITCNDWLDDQLHQKKQQDAKGVLIIHKYHVFINLNTQGKEKRAKLRRITVC